MKVIHLDLERKRRQLSCSQQLVARMAKSLLQTYAVSKDLDLSVHFGYGKQMTNEQAITIWILDVLQSMDQELADKIFPVLCDRFQTKLSRLPTHMHGGDL